MSRLSWSAQLSCSQYCYTYPTMSLATLVNGADCGPLNPLQGLTKNLNSDRGLQQVHATGNVYPLDVDEHFHRTTLGPTGQVLREPYANPCPCFCPFPLTRRGQVFRTAQTVSPSFEEDATRFFSASQRASTIPPIAQSPFDLNALCSTLPAPVTTSSRTHTPSSLLSDQVPASSWAMEFLTHTTKPQVAKSLQPVTPQEYPEPSTQEQLFQPSFPQCASHPTFSVTVVRMLLFAALQPQLPMRATYIPSFAHITQTTTPNFHSSSQIDSMLQGFLWDPIQPDHVQISNCKMRFRLLKGSPLLSRRPNLSLWPSPTHHLLKPIYWLGQLDY